MLNRVYCTYFDHNYLSRGLALYHSLRRHVPDCRLWVLCLSGECHQILTSLDLPGIVPVRLEDFEAGRSRGRCYSFQSKHCRILLHMLASLDALCAGTRAERRMGDLSRRRSVLLRDSPMRSMTNCTTRRSRSFRIAIAPKIARLRKFGIYNVGWVGSRNDSDGLAVIRWWREKCIEWCHDYVDGDRFADQGYLDSFPGLSPRVRVDRKHRGQSRALECRQLRESIFVTAK